VCCSVLGVREWLCVFVCVGFLVFFCVCICMSMGHVPDTNKYNAIQYCIFHLRSSVFNCY